MNEEPSRMNFFKLQGWKNFCFKKYIVHSFYNTRYLNEHDVKFAFI